MSEQPASGVSSDRAVAALMARAVMFVVFIGSGISFVLLITGSSAAGPVCIGSGVIAFITLMIGGYYVGRARTSG